jgi:hypothetical protein
MTDPGCAGLRAAAIGPGARVLLVATEGATALTYHPPR